MKYGQKSKLSLLNEEPHMQQMYCKNINFQRYTVKCFIGTNF